jgi:1,5-anhydro-D-fructose reductase (1,5-anhydro-D-mannitol-forming)
MTTHSSTQPLRIAMLGTGGIAEQFLAPALTRTPNVALWSVLSRDRARAQQFAQTHRAQSPTPAYDNLPQLLQDPSLDAVLIATPDKLHAAQCINAARAGKHVFCEKPMATSFAEGHAMVQACAEAKVTLGVAYHLRHHIGHKLLVERVRAGAIGRVRHVRAQWTYAAQDASNWRANSQVGRWWSMGGVGTHCLDMVRWILGPEAGEVTALKAVSSSPKFGASHDESACLVMSFQDGSIAEVFASVLFKSPRRVEVFGDLGYACAEHTLGPRGTGLITINDEPIAFEPADPYVGELEDFAHAVRTNRPPAVDGREGLRNVELLCAAVPSRDK